jgi:hypothetical protein
VTDFQHRCQDSDCVYIGQPTSPNACKCHKTAEQMMRDEIDRLQAGAGMAQYWREQYLLARAHMERVRAALDAPVTRDAAQPSDGLSELEQQFMHVLEGWEEDSSSPAAVSALQYALGAVRDAMHRSRHAVSGAGVANDRA